MRHLSPCLLIFVSLLASASDQRYEKAQRQARRIAAIATDKTGRNMVSMSMADTLKMPRPEMIVERRRLALDYGSFFVLHQLIAQGANLDALSAKLKAGKTVWQIGNETHADWGRIAAESKKENSRIDDYIYRHFLNKKNYDADLLRDFEDKYDPARDSAPTDFAVTPQEMIDAQRRYLLWRDQGSKAQGSARNMALGEELAARMDHAEAIHNTNGGISPPAAGGVPPK